MAKQDHCIICDYTEGGGSGMAGTNPGRNGKVRRNGDEFLCDSCMGSISSSYAELVQGDEDVNKIQD